jgi:hypothetical protein
MSRVLVNLVWYLGNVHRNYKTMIMKKILLSSILASAFILFGLSGAQAQTKSVKAVKKEAKEAQLKKGATVDKTPVKKSNYTATKVAPVSNAKSLPPKVQKINAPKPAEKKQLTKVKGVAAEPKAISKDNKK